MLSSQLALAYIKTARVSVTASAFEHFKGKHASYDCRALHRDIPLFCSVSHSSSTMNVPL